MIKGYPKSTAIAPTGSEFLFIFKGSESNSILPSGNES